MSLKFESQSKIVLSKDDLLMALFDSASEHGDSRTADVLSRATSGNTSIQHNIFNDTLIVTIRWPDADESA